MVADVNIQKIAITYRMEDIQDVGVGAYVRGVADWYFSFSLHHIKTTSAIMDGDRFQEFDGKLESSGRFMWGVARLVMLVASPILLIAKFACNRDTNAILIGHERESNDGVTTETSTKVFPYKKTVFQNIIAKKLTTRPDESWLEEQKFNDESFGKKAERLPSGYVTRGEYFRSGQLKNGTITSPTGEILRNGAFEYVRSDELWYYERGDEGGYKDGILVEKKVDNTVYRGEFNDAKDLIRGEMVDTDGNIFRGNFSKDGDTVYMSEGIKITGSGVIGGIFNINGSPLQAYQSKSNGVSTYFPEILRHMSKKCTVVTADGNEYQLGYYASLSDAEVAELSKAEYGILPEFTLKKDRLAFMEKKKEAENRCITRDTLSSFAEKVFAPVVACENALDMDASENILRKAVVDELRKADAMGMLDSSIKTYIEEHFPLEAVAE